MNYADWIIRLNYVLNPGKTLPEQRIKLDAALRQAQYIPVEVTFGDPNAVQVRARHRIYWDFSDRDRELIRQWDGLLLRGDLKKVSFQDYQRSLVASVAKHSEAGSMRTHGIRTLKRGPQFMRRPSSASPLPSAPAR